MDRSSTILVVPSESGNTVIVLRGRPRIPRANAFVIGDKDGNLSPADASNAIVKLFDRNNNTPYENDDQKT